MNPFTRAILQKLKNRQLDTFVRRWDELEALVIGVYKAGAATIEDERQYQRARLWLLANYPRWQAELEPYWRATRIKGEPLSEDPFPELLSRSRVQDFSGDWSAMQTLPAARESLNEFLLELSH